MSFMWAPMRMKRMESRVFYAGLSKMSNVLARWDPEGKEKIMVLERKGGFPTLSIRPQGRRVTGVGRIVDVFRVIP
ncbi:MAG: hypothetical protein AB7D57_14455 [Desulfovibrionaceae bacterium]